MELHPDFVLEHELSLMDAGEPLIKRRSEGSVSSSSCLSGDTCVHEAHHSSLSTNSPPLPLPQLLHCPPSFIPPPRHGSEARAAIRVRLTLTVSPASLAAPPGVHVADCGECRFCLDKPRFGGPGTKRQKCAKKRVSLDGGTRIWASVRPMSLERLEHMEMYAHCPLPSALVSATRAGPLPLVWAFQRPRRARPLPPAFVLMYHCESRVPLDTSFLNASLANRFNAARARSERQPKPCSPRSVCAAHARGTKRGRGEPAPACKEEADLRKMQSAEAQLLQLCEQGPLRAYPLDKGGAVDDLLEQTLAMRPAPSGTCCAVAHFDIEDDPSMSEANMTEEWWWEATLHAHDSAHYAA
ncbi:hypothetical protein AB1Y20_004306 [Prymnesium parvum]|uniref:CXXC-type domain-containing protein n=1 Tax=Prymnesium parvum TaxID=97485 RepID=A0AB34IW04_PRYPA